VSLITEAELDLPNGWQWVSIGETGEYINGFAFKPSHRELNGLPIVRIQNLTDESKPLNTTNLEVPTDYKIDTGDMLMSWSATLDVFFWRRGPALLIRPD
jgi:type I restriction enzyme S subunit